MKKEITCQNCWTQNTLDCRHCPNRSNLEIELKNAKEAEKTMGRIFLSGIVYAVILITVSLFI